MRGITDKQKPGPVPLRKPVDSVQQFLALRNSALVDLLTCIALGQTAVVELPKDFFMCNRPCDGCDGKRDLEPAAMSSSLPVKQCRSVGPRSAGPFRENA